MMLGRQPQLLRHVASCSDGASSLSHACIAPIFTVAKARLQLPNALLEHVPVAALTNGVLAALNDLRHCALPQLRQPLADELRACVERCAHALMRVEAQRFGGGRGGAEDPSVGSRSAFVGACKALADVAAPYLEGCYGRVFKGGEKLVDARGAVSGLRNSFVSSGLRG